MGQRHERHDVRPLTESPESMIEKLRKQYAGEDRYWNIDIFVRGKFVYINWTPKTLRGHLYCNCCDVFIPMKDIEVRENVKDWRGRLYVSWICKKCGNSLKSARMKVK